MRFIIWKIFLPVLLVGLDAWWLHQLDAGNREVLREMSGLVRWAHFPLGQIFPLWATRLSNTPWREGWVLLSPLLLNTALLGVALGWWIDWRLEERARGRRGLVDSLIRNFGEPRGLAGALAAMVMNRGNLRLNRYCIQALQLQPDDHVVDIGFGGGASFGMVLAKLGSGSLTGVDPSEDMVARARRIFGRQCRSGRLRVVGGVAGSLPLGAGSMDKALAVNTLYFWPDLAGGFEEIRRVLRPGGFLAVGMRPQDSMGFFRDYGFHIYSERQVVSALHKAGFNKIEVEDRPDGKFGAKIFKAWSTRGSRLPEPVEQIVDELEKKLGTLLDMEI
jgi:SAM-dependent methyltransferase